jgi:NAD(P)-dependent dehydrogenase (short-subunit alcohol dehydrogenase family)
MTTDTIDPAAMFRLDDKVAVVTGASSGFGARIGRVLHAAGATVVLAARRRDRLDELAATLKRAEAVTCDVTEEADCRALIDGTVERHGRVDILVNNAGVGYLSAGESDPPETFRRVLDTNVHATFVLCQAASQHMLRQGSGVILNMASVSGLQSMREAPMLSYTTSKAAIIMMTRELATQWAGRGIRVNALAPGFFPTELNAESFADPGFNEWVNGRSPLGRPGREGELDGAVLLLTSDASSFMTGSVVVVDGGWTLI